MNQSKTNRKKILYVITKSVWGGAQRYVYDLATHLPRDQFEPAVACGGSGPLVAKLRAAGIRVISISGLERNINLLKETISLWSLFKIFLRERPDIIHLSSSKAGGLGAIAAFASKLLTLNFEPIRRTQGRLLTVFTVHGWAFNESRSEWQKAVIRFASWFASLFQDKVIAVNSADYKAAKKFIPARKLALIRHGLARIEAWPVAETKNLINRRTGQTLDEKALVVGTIAELTKNKGLEHLIAAIRNLKTKEPNQKFKAIIIGEGENRSKLEKKINELGLTNDVFLVGFIADAPRLLSAFDIFVLPSLKEGLPYALMEAMASGRPAVATDIGGIPDLIEHEKNGLLVEAKDHLALAAAIGRLAANPDLRERLASAARQKVVEEYSIRNMIDKTISLYNRIAWSGPTEVRQLS